LQKCFLSYAGLLIQKPRLFYACWFWKISVAVYLPIAAVLIVGGGTSRVLLSVLIAVAAVFLVLVIAVRYGEKLSEFAGHDSDEIILLSVLGTVLLVGGTAQRLQVSAAIGAFLVGIAVSGPMREQSHRLVSPLRDFFAAIFFFFFGLQIAPASLVSVLGSAGALGAVTAATKIGSGYWAARRFGADRRAGLRAGSALIARGEFSIVIAGMGAGLEPQLEPLSAAYVLLLAVLGPILARAIK
jgi:CPA2 family monovalent cation:H+ antiporter-2